MQMIPGVDSVSEKASTVTKSPFDDMGFSIGDFILVGLVVLFLTILNTEPCI